MTLKNILKDKLVLFDSFDLDDENQRRASLIPLYDIFLTVLAHVGVKFCEINRAKFSGPLLTAGWGEVKEYLEKVGIVPQSYNDEIINFHKIRNRTHHDETSIPDKSRLIDIRKMVPKFVKWIITIGNEYYNEKIRNKTFTQRFKDLSDGYARRTEYIFDTYGDEPPFIAKGDVLFEGEFYQEIRECRDYLNSRKKEIQCANDISREDLDKLIDLVSDIERLDAKEYVYLERNICPKCGNKIVETQTSIGGSYQDPAPTHIAYRVGCDSCDFELDRETIGI